MAETRERRELYIDVVMKEAELSEIYLYQVDFKQDDSFLTNEYFFTQTEDETAEETVNPLEAFRTRWEQLCLEEISTNVYATDAGLVMKLVFEPIMKRYSDFIVKPRALAGGELLHDCISMGRVISMSAFDEISYLSSGIRRRMKERYHEHVDEVKRECKEHIFIRQTEESMKLLITDAEYHLKKQVQLSTLAKEETVAIRLREILALYPDADVLVDAITVNIYRLFHNMSIFMGVEDAKAVFSLQSMLTALGKEPTDENLVRMYRLYIKNQEDMRFGRFLPETCFSTHCFYLPVQLSEEKEWKRQFAKNTLWKQNGREGYQILAEGDLKGKYIIRSGKELFTLKLKRIAIQRYLKKYAMVCIEVENYCYPGEADKKKLQLLAKSLFAKNHTFGTNQAEIKIKDGKQTYALTTVPMAGGENPLWLNGLLGFGKKTKKQKKKGLLLTALRENMYCMEHTGVAEEDQIVQSAMMRDGIYRRLEDLLARAVRPEKADCPLGSLSRRQKKEIYALYEMYRYLTVAFGESYEAAPIEEKRQLFKQTEAELDTEEVKVRLQFKFGLFF